MNLLAIFISFLISSGIIKGGPDVLSVQSEVNQIPVTVSVTVTEVPPVTVTVTATPMEWQYPGSQTSNNKFQTTDDAKKVTDWYVAKIKSMGLPVTSYVKTSANEKIKNNLVAAKDGFKVRIVITQDNASQPVVISITVDNP